MQKAGEYAFLFLLGFHLYSMIEIIARGYTHWTMAVTGGLILSILYHIQLHLRISLLTKCLLGMLLITAIEFTVGVFDNLIMQWHVWDYSAVPLNLLGQICLPFSILWFFLCIPAYFICFLTERRFHPKELT